MNTSQNFTFSVFLPLRIFFGACLSVGFFNFATAQEIPSIVEGIDRGYIADNNAFVGLRQIQGLEFEAQALTWTPNGIETSGRFIITNDVAGAYTAFAGEDVVAEFSRAPNRNGQTYWGVEDVSIESAWSFGGLQGITNRSDEAARELLSSWEREPDSLVSLEQIRRLQKAFPEETVWQDSGGALVPASEAGFFTSYLSSIGEVPQIRTASDFAGRPIAAVGITPSQLVSLSDAVSEAGVNSLMNFSSRNFSIPDFEVAKVGKPSIFDPFFLDGLVSDADKLNFVQPFSRIAPSRSCEVTRASSGEPGVGTISCEYHSAEHGTGKQTWALMFVRFSAHQTGDEEVTISYFNSFRFYKGKLSSPPDFFSEYRPEAEFPMGREGNLTKQVGLNAVRYVLNSL